MLSSTLRLSQFILLKILIYSRLHYAGGISGIVVILRDDVGIVYARPNKTKNITYFLNKLKHIHFKLIYVTIERSQMMVIYARKL